MTEHGHCKRLLPDCDTVLAMIRRSGACDAEEFLAGLDLRFRARYLRYFERLRDHHNIKSPENLRHLDKRDDVDVFELKADNYRLYIVRHQVTWYATHGRKKPANSRVNTEIQKAINIFWEWNGN